LKLTSAPPTAISRTSDEIANCVKADTVSACSALSVFLLICSYSHLRVDLRGRVVQSGSFLSTCPKVLSSERQKGMNPFRICAATRRRGVLGERLVVDDVHRRFDLFQYPLNHLVPSDLTFAMAVTASTHSGGGGGTSRTSCSPPRRG